MLKSNLCDYSNAYILPRGDITIIGCNLPTEVAFKNFVRFIKGIILIDGTTIDDTASLDVVMPMYNQLEYRWNYSDITDSLWFYSKYEATTFNANIKDNNTFKLLKCKAKLLGNIEADEANEILRNTTITVQLKYLCIKAIFGDHLKCHWLITEKIDLKLI